MWEMQFCKKLYPMMELFLFVCLIAILVFLFGPFELIMEDDDV